jgi:predicted MPP superfamily phosphohydrolase
MLAENSGPFLPKLKKELPVAALSSMHDSHFTASA